MVLGLILGLLFNPQISVLPESLYKLLETYAFTPIGKIFINAIKMLVVPMVFISLVNGVTQINDIKKLGRVGGKTIAYYLLTTSMAIIIGLSVALIIQPGANSLLVSDNAVDIFDSANYIVLKMIDTVMLLTPIGVFALLIKVAATLGLDSLVKLSLYMVTVLLCLLIHLILVYTGSLFVFTKLNPIVFFKKFWNVMTLSFSTSSSNATLPVTGDTVVTLIVAKSENEIDKESFYSNKNLMVENNA